MKETEMTAEQWQQELQEMKMILEDMRETNDEIRRWVKRLFGEQKQDTRKFMEPDIADSAKVPIGKAAEILGISRDTLRKHTDNGLIKCSFQKGTYRRQYRGADIKKYWRTCQ